MRSFLAGDMYVQLDSTKQNISTRNNQVYKTIAGLKPILGKILLDKDGLFFCPYINANTSTLRILFIFQ